MPPPLVNLDEADEIDPQELAQLNHFRDNGVYDLYLTLFRELHLDPYPENTPVNLERVRHILEQLELVNDYLQEIGSFQSHLAQRLAHKLKEQFRIRHQFLNFFNGEFARDLIKKFQEDALFQLGRERLALTLLEPEEFGKLSRQERRERSETVRRVKKVLFDLTREEVIEQVTTLVNDEEWIE
jgi:hypothetical protein